MSADRPQIRIAWNGDAALAYQVIGAGPVDLLYRQGWISNVELNWDHPLMSGFLRGLSAGRRLIVTDPRGSGISERSSPSDVPPLELQVDDAIAVLDAAGSPRAVLMATNEQAFVACMFAATYPERTVALILYEASANFQWSEETPWEWNDERWDAQERELRTVDLNVVETFLNNPDGLGARDPSYREWWRRYNILSGGLGAAIAVSKLYRWTDLRPILPSIRVPVLVLDRPAHPEPSWHPAAEFIASRIPGARRVELPGTDDGLWIGPGPALAAIDAFLADVRREEAELDRALATVLFTDMVSSTEVAARVGDRAWGELVRGHHATVRGLLQRFRGVEVDTAGDGFFATFDGPGRAVRCAQAIVDAVAPLGVEVRAGIHAGEVELIDGKASGLAVNIGARIGSQAGPSEILVSSTVKDLCAGSDIAFVDAGEHELKGVPERWRLFRVGAPD
jgi:class 3 adenylate cyclase